MREHRSLAGDRPPAEAVRALAAKVESKASVGPPDYLGFDPVLTGSVGGVFSLRIERRAGPQRAGFRGLQPLVVGVIRPAAEGGSNVDLDLSLLGGQAIPALVRLIQAFVGSCLVLGLVFSVSTQAAVTWDLVMAVVVGPLLILGLSEVAYRSAIHTAVREGELIVAALKDCVGDASGGSPPGGPAARPAARPPVEQRGA